MFKKPNMKKSHLQILTNKSSIKLKNKFSLFKLQLLDIFPLIDHRLIEYKSIDIPYDVKNTQWIFLLIQPFYIHISILQNLANRPLDGPIQNRPH